MGSHRMRLRVFRKVLLLMMLQALATSPIVPASCVCVRCKQENSRPSRIKPILPRAVVILGVTDKKSLP
jgi:hypothetical protein